MDFYAECEKRVQGRMQKIGELSYKRQQASRAIEDNQRLVRDIDEEITAHEAAIGELEQAKRNFNSYLAVKEGALTMEQIAEGVRAAAEAEPTETQAIEEAGEGSARDESQGGM